MTDEREEAWREAVVRESSREYWRGLSGLLDTSEFRDVAQRESPAGAAEFSDGLTRQSFIKLLGASVALASLSACVEQPTERVLPYTTRPSELTPGIPLHRASPAHSGGIPITDASSVCKLEARALRR